jgi:hypothetical protein
MLYTTSAIGDQRNNRLVPYQLSFIDAKLCSVPVFGFHEAQDYLAWVNLMHIMLGISLSGKGQM